MANILFYTVIHKKNVPLNFCVATQLRCGGLFNNHVIAHFPHRVPVKEVLKSVDIWRRSGQLFGGTFYGSRCSKRCCFQGRYGADGGDLLHRFRVETDTEVTEQVLDPGAKFRQLVYDSRPVETTLGVATVEAQFHRESTTRWQNESS